MAEYGNQVQCRVEFWCYMNMHCTYTKLTDLFQLECLTSRVLIFYGNMKNMAGLPLMKINSTL